MMVLLKEPEPVPGDCWFLLSRNARTGEHPPAWKGFVVLHGSTSQPGTPCTAQHSGEARLSPSCW